MRSPVSIRHALALTGLLLAAISSTASAETSTSTVSGTVASELSVSVSTPPPALALSRLTAATSAAVVAVAATTPWTLTIHDASATTPGKLDKVNCTTRAALTGSLTNALQWSNALAGTSGTLSATPATVATGSGVAAPSVLFTQPLSSSDAVSAAECYELAVTWTVS